MRAPDKGFWTIINEDLKSNIQQGNREQITCRFGLMFRSILMRALFLSITTVSSNYWGAGEHFSSFNSLLVGARLTREEPQKMKNAHILLLYFLF